MKTIELSNTLTKAVSKLKESFDFPNTEPMRESAIQRFEYTFELSWKLMNSILKDQSLDTVGTKNIIREAAKLGLIDDVEKWFEFGLARNKASHIYLEDIALEVYNVSQGDFYTYVEELIEKSKKYI